MIPVSYPSNNQKKEILRFYSKRYRADIEAIMKTVTGEFSGADIRVAFENCLIQKQEITSKNVISNLVSAR